MKKDKSLSLDMFLFLTAVFVFSSFMLSGVGKESIGGIIVETARRNSVTLTFAHWWQDELDHNALNAIVAEFERTNPGIIIKLDNLSYHDMEDIILNGVNDKIAGFSENFSNADIFALDPRWLYGLIKNDMLEPLAPYMEATSFVPVMQTEGQERVFSEWALPLVSFMSPLFYNIEVLSAAGFDRPPKTRSDILRYARAITDRNNGRYGVALSLNQDYPQGVYIDIYSWIWASGAVILNQGESNFTSQQVIDSLDFLNDLYKEGLLSPDSFSKTREEKQEEFISGKVGMMIASIQDVEVIRKRMGDANFGITTIPVPDLYSGKPAFGLTNWYVGISRESRYKNEAWTFISYLARRSPILAAASYAVPGSGNGLEDYLTGDAFYSKAYRIYEGGDGIQEFAGYPAVHILDYIVREEIFNMFETDKSARATAETIQKRWEEVFQNAVRFGS